MPGIAIERLQAQRKVEQVFAMSGVNVIVVPVTVYMKVTEGNSLWMTIRFAPFSV
ncbi:MAG TPA: hypothetical protein VIZ31_02020 [Vicinamibacteria bacterium]